MYKVVIAAALSAGLAAVPTFAADNSTTIQPSTQSSGPGVKGTEGGKNGPAATQGNTGKMDSSMGNNGASTGSSGKNIDPSTQPSQDSTGVKGSTGGKNGPAAKPAGQD
jgi:hypothetical protein